MVMPPDIKLSGIKPLQSVYIQTHPPTQHTLLYTYRTTSYVAPTHGCLHTSSKNSFFFGPRFGRGSSTFKNYNIVVIPWLFCLDFCHVGLGMFLQ